MCTVNELLPKFDIYLNTIIEKDGYLTYKVNKRNILMKGEGFFNDLYEVEIKGKTRNGDKETNIFVKSLVLDKEIEWVSISDTFQTELFAYKELSKIFAELQENASVPSHEMYKFVKSYEESDRKVILLENLTKIGYTTAQRLDVISLNLAEMYIKQLARFHGLSFVLQKKLPEYFDNKIKTLKHLYALNSTYPQVIKNMIKSSMKYVDNDVQHSVENVIYKLADRISDYFNKENMNICLCHGDYRLSNIMTKLSDNEVADVIPVDYQFMHYGCPVIDFIYFIFLSTDRKFRKAHLSHLKDLYHDTLRTFLEYFNFDVDLVYPRKMFDKYYKDNLDYGLLMSFVLLPLFMAQNDKVPDLFKETSEFDFNVNDKYKERQRDAIEDFIEWGYL